MLKLMLQQKQDIIYHVNCESKKDTTLADNFARCTLTDFQNSFTNGLNSKCAIRVWLNVPSFFKRVIILLCETLDSKIDLTSKYND